MIIISYDIRNDNLRTKFAKRLEELGARRLQYSVFEVWNSTRILDNIRFVIKEEFAPRFSMDDSVVVFHCEEEKTERYGNAVHHKGDLLFF